MGISPLSTSSYGGGYGGLVCVWGGACACVCVVDMCAYVHVRDREGEGGREKEG